MTVADHARASALQLEIKKDGLAQRQDGRWQLKVIIHPNDMPAALSLAAMGTRYMAALVEIGDDELPVTGPKVLHGRSQDAGNAGTNASSRETEPARTSPALPRHWRDMKPSQQAGIRCNEPAFWTLLNEGESGLDVWVPDALIDDADKAADYVRLICGVKSRSELDINQVAAEKWRELDDKFSAWMQV